METPQPTMPAASGTKLRRVLSICQKMNSERDFGTLLDLVARETTALLDADRTSVFLLDRENNELWSKVALGSDEELRFDARLGIAGSVASTGEVINVTDAPYDPRFYAAIDERSGYHTKSVLAVPLRAFEGDVIGAFQVLNQSTGAFTQEDEEILKALAAQVAITIQTVRLLEVLKRQKDELQQENTQLWHEAKGRFATSNIVGTSNQIQAVVRLIEQIHESTVSVLITGESGTGKELVARAIHYSSSRAKKPFVPLNCAALPDDLVESELFGIEKGVATGVEKRIGRFEAATQGTLFLDEIGDLSPRAQAKILRVLQEGAIEKVGTAKSVQVDVRILAATNKNLEAAIADGTFREDLYYRLNVVHLRLPALREIPEDIPLLVNHFLAKICREVDRPAPEFTAEAMKCVANYHWPGNVRQLENEIKRLVAVTRRRRITAQDLDAGIQAAGSTARASPPGTHKLQDAVINLERSMIAKALSAHNHNQLRAARTLGLSRQGLINKMKRYQMKSS